MWSAVALAGLSGCAPTLPVTGRVSATFVPRPVLLGPTQKVGGGSAKVYVRHPLDLAEAPLASSSQDVTETSTEWIKKTKSERSSSAELGVAILGFFDSRLGSGEEALHETDAFVVDQLVIKVATIDSLGSGGYHSRRLYVGKKDLALVHLAPDEGATTPAPGGTK